MPHGLSCDFRFWKMVDREAEKVISSKGFLYLSHSMLSKMLQRNLHATESLIYKRAIAWAQEECKRQSTDPTPEHVRSVLGDAFFLIRFPTMSFDEFNQGQANSNYLTPQVGADVGKPFAYVHYKRTQFSCF